MKKIILLITCFFAFNATFAQKTQQIHVKLIQPGIEYQFEINNDFLASIDLGFGLINLTYNREDNIDAYLSTFSNITLKKVYNHFKVLNRNNNLSSFSGNYYGLRYLGYNKNVSNGSKSESFNYAVGPVWGAQRYFNTFYYQIELGIGHHNSHEINELGPLLRFCLGINLKQW